MIKELIVDTETTGLNAKTDRIIELAAIELIDGRKSNRVFCSYFNPWPVNVSEGAFGIHGISNAFLKDKPRFKQGIRGFLDLAKGHKLIAHNAKFDSEIIDCELRRCGMAPMSKGNWYDTLKLAKQVYPGLSNSLANLRKRLKINVVGRAHSALRDCEVLRKVYEALLEESRRDLF
ncbi:MAG: exonuclease domain-containing protein [Candidatus Hodgkinia cicadicola]